MKSYIIFGSMDCIYCRRAKNMLEEHEKHFTFVDIHTRTGRHLLDNYKSLNVVDQDYRTMPMIVLVDSSFLGGYDKLVNHLNKKKRKSKKTKRKTRKKNRRKLRKKRKCIYKKTKK